MLAEGLEFPSYTKCPWRHWENVSVGPTAHANPAGSWVPRPGTHNEELPATLQPHTVYCVSLYIAQNKSVLVCKGSCKTSGGQPALLVRTHRSSADGSSSLLQTRVFADTGVHGAETALKVKAGVRFESRLEFLTFILILGKKRSHLTLKSS